MRSLTVRTLIQSPIRNVRCPVAGAPFSRYFSDDGGSLYSKDIAFKPAESGWGAGKKYEQNYDNIFGKKKDNATPRGDETITTHTETQTKK